MSDRQEYEQHDLIHGDKWALGQALKMACMIGADDHEREAQGESAPQRTGDELARLLCTQWRRGHASALRDAYRIGRLHAGWAGRD